MRLAQTAANLLPGIILIAMWGALVWVFLTPEPEQSHGFAHHRFSEMDQGGAGTTRHGQVLVCGWFLGTSMIAIFVGLLAWGSEQALDAADHATRRWTFVFSGLVYAGIFTILMVCYADSLRQPEMPAYIGSFPAATWWLLFGVWLAPGLFVGIFVFGFSRWFVTPQAMIQFRKLIDDKQGEPTSRTTSPRQEMT